MFAYINIYISKCNCRALQGDVLDKIYEVVKDFYSDKKWLFEKGKEKSQVVNAAMNR